MLVELYAKTDVGRIRSGNEDNFLVLDLTSTRAWVGLDGAGANREAPPDGLRRFELGERGVVFVVSDGMGGALAGDVASRMAVETVRDMLIAEAAEGGEGEGACGPETALIECLRNAIEYANFAIHRKSQEDARCAGMGATLTAAALVGSTLDFIQVGDSRAYLIRQAEIKLATKDQSLVQQLVDVGQISEEEAETHMFRNVILQALGAQAELVPVVGRVRLRQGDLLLLCSDGLSGKLRAEDIRQIVAQAKDDLPAACDELVKEANRRGGEDNITVVLARFTGEDLPAPDSRKIIIESPTLSDDRTLTYEDEQDTEHP
ncbi:MAG TPA: PP2C family serine/threonine-protein phosphatase [Pyrinomonadaceae bacterium]|nr:PP2C family serine/threonine-protein phosphatase [Pyrinomonadaceae bacterium]